MKSRTALLLGLAFLGMAMLPRSAFGEVDEATRAARWAELRAAIFSARPIEDGAGLLVLEAPDRAEDAALVPVRITFDERLRPHLRQLYLVIDDNPSPLAGSFAFGPAALPSAIATRVRVDDYTYLRAVVETDDGTLYATQRFIKAAGGCSAPAGKDQALAMERVGRMKMTLAGRPQLRTPVEAHLLIGHPNNSGMQMDQVTRHYVPADFVRSVKVTYNGQTVISVESDISISEDPSLTFAFVPSAPSGELMTEVEDSSNRHFQQSWPVNIEPGT